MPVRKTRKAATKRGCRAKGRAMAACFIDGEKIRHKGSCDSTWEGHFSKASGGIIYKGHVYKAVSTFARDHYTSENKRMNPVSRAGHPHGNNTGKGGVNGWLECEIYRDGQWISTFELKAHV